jgi:hypothetical protein
VPRSRPRSRSSARANAHAAGFYVALLHDGEVELAAAFARWWLSQGGEEISSLEVAPGSTIDGPYDLDELGIDQEDFEWP